MAASASPLLYPLSRSWHASQKPALLRPSRDAIVNALRMIDSESALRPAADWWVLAGGFG
jgi:hypothetical protein